MPSETVADFYKRHHAGETGFARYGFTFGGDKRGAWIRTRVGTGKRVLDIGCRDGTLTSKFADGNDVTGIDFDDVALTRARDSFGFKTQVVDLNGGKLPFDDGAFDVVVAGEVLEHLQLPSIVVSEIRRVLAPGGRFVGTVPNAFRLQNRLVFLRGEDFETDPTHLHQFSPQAVRQMLSDFSGVDVDFICGRKAWMWPRLLAAVLAFEARV